MLKYLILTFAFLTTSFCSSSVGSISSNNRSTIIGNDETVTDVSNSELLILVNQLRKEGCKCGRKKMRQVPPIKWNNQLEQAAFNHAKDMAKNNFFKHQGSDGSSISDRIGATGYNWQAVGENIFWGEASPREVFQTWKDSPSHCKNMMNADYDEMGIAQMGNYWVQDFGKAF